MTLSSLSFLDKILRKAEKYLRKYEIPNPRRDVEILLCHFLKCPLNRLLSISENEIKNVFSLWWEAIEKRGERIPVQYLCGKTQFHGRDFLCDERALIPRPETEELVIIAESFLKFPRCDILDLGCGSGVIGITLALNLAEFSPQVCCADISRDALALSQKNAKKMNVSQLYFLESNLFEKIEGKFDVICANLPYVESSEKKKLQAEIFYEPEIALFAGEDGLSMIKSCLLKAKKFLKKEGKLILEIGHLQAKRVIEFAKQGGFSHSYSCQDLNGIHRFIIAE